jgi:hypothetical protein
MRVGELFGCAPAHSRAVQPLPLNLHAAAADLRAGHASLTRLFRKAASTRVRHTGRPCFGQVCPFIRTIKPRDGNGDRNSNTFRFLFLR